MTFEKLNKLIEKYNIPHDVLFQSDSGWECNESEMDGIFFMLQTKVLFLY